METYLSVSDLGSKLDKNDYMFSNSPYTLEHERPAAPEPDVQSNLPPSPPMLLTSPPAKIPSQERETESVGPHVTSDPGVEGINEYRTNTFQAFGWMRAPALPEEAPDVVAPEVVAQAVRLLEEAAADSVPNIKSARPTLGSTPAAMTVFEEDEGMESDTEYERREAERRTKNREEPNNDSDSKGLEDTLMEKARGEDDVVMTDGHERGSQEG